MGMKERYENIQKMGAKVVKPERVGKRDEVPVFDL